LNSLDYLTYSASGTCLTEVLPSIIYRAAKMSVLTGFLSRCLQYWLSIQAPSQQYMTKTVLLVLAVCSMHTNHIYN